MKTKNALSSALLTLALCPSLHAQDTKEQGHGARTSGAVTIVSAAGASFTYNKMLETYNNSSTELFAKAADRKTLISRSEIAQAASKFRQGDELRITYLTSEAEERAIRISQLESRHITVRADINRVRNQIVKLNKAGKVSEAAISGNQLRDLNILIRSVEDDLHSLKVLGVSVTSRVTMRSVDLDLTKIQDAERFLYNKVHAGKDILKIERVSAARRQRVSGLRALTVVQVGIMAVGGIVTLQQVFGGDQETALDDELAGGTIYAPELKTRAE